MQNVVSRGVIIAVLAAAGLAPTAANAQLIKYATTKLAPAINTDAGQTFGVDNGGISAPVFNLGSLSKGFEGISQYDVASVGRNFIPPDTIGAAGRTQYVQFTNGGFAVYDKATGLRTAFTSDTAFWQAAGRAGIPNGDPRVLYDATAQRFIAISFGANTKDLHIAVSNTSNALGGWKSTTFE